MASRVLRVIGVAVAVILALEAGLRVFGDRLDQPLEWYHSAAQQSVADMARLHDAGMTSDVVFVGTSMIREDIQIPIIEDQLSSIDRASNVALPAAQTSVMREWLLDQVIPRLHPGRVVWGVESIDFNGGRSVPVVERYDTGRAVRGGVLGSADRVLSATFALSRHRAQLRNPSFVVDFFRARPNEATTPLEDLLSPVNEGRRANDKKNKKEFGRIRDDALGGFVIGDREVADFEYTIEALRSQGIEVVVVLMPIPNGYVRAHPNGNDDFANFQEWLHGEAARLGVALIDHARTMPSDAFIDYTHLASAGALEFSQILAADLDSLGW